jgi:hypothetical protein
MRACLAWLAGVLLATAALAADIKPGATMQVKPNSIWFDEAAQLARWQALKKSGDDKALTAYQDQLLGQRDAWQFIYPLNVEIIALDAKTGRVHVKMLTPGRFVGLDMFVDRDALMQ